MAPASDVFVRAVMAALNCGSPMDLAEEMGWKRGTERLVAKWLAGSNKPGYEYTMEMLERCGWVNMGADAPGVVEKPHDRLGEVLEGVTELLRGQKTVISRLKIVQPAPQKAPAGKHRTATEK